MMEVGLSIHSSSWSIENHSLSSVMGFGPLWPQGSLLLGPEPSIISGGPCLTHSFPNYSSPISITSNKRNSYYNEELIFNGFLPSWMAVERSEFNQQFDISSSVGWLAPILLYFLTWWGRCALILCRSCFQWPARSMNDMLQISN